MTDPGDHANGNAAGHNGKKRPAPAIYHAIMAAIDQRRRELGITVEVLSDLAGHADRYYPKLLSCDSPSGRIGRYETIQEVIDALFPAGFALEIAPKHDPEKKCSTPLSTSIRAFDSHRKLPLAAAEFFRQCGSRGGRASAARRGDQLSRTKRKRIARHAARSRWNRHATNGAGLEP